MFGDSSDDEQVELLFTDSEPDSEDEKSESEINQTLLPSSSVLIILYPNSIQCKETFFKNLDVLRVTKENYHLTKVVIANHILTKGIDTYYFWKNVSSETTDISIEDVLSSKIVPANDEYATYAITYATKAKEQGRSRICFRMEDKETNVSETLISVLKEQWNVPYEVISYGGNPFTETLSFLQSIVPIQNDLTTFFNVNLFEDLTKYNSIALCGEQASVHATSSILTSKIHPSRTLIIEPLLCENPCFHGMSGISVVESL